MTKVTDFIIKDIDSIDARGVRGGIADQLLWRSLHQNTLSQIDLAPPSVKFVNNTYFQCSHCDVIQKEFHSTCPQCGAPMEIDTKFVSEATPITYPAEVGESYTLRPYGVGTVVRDMWGF